MFGLSENAVALVEIDYEYWETIFQKEKRILEGLLRDKQIVIEHVGSTAIPGIMAKPIIDIAIGVQNFKEVDNIIRILSINSYEYRPENGGDGRLLLLKTVEGMRTHHIHVEEFGGEHWNNHMLFRDCLRNDVAQKQEYMQLKMKLAKMYPNDRRRYTKEKAEFIQKVLHGLTG